MYTILDFLVSANEWRFGKTFRKSVSLALIVAVLVFPRPLLRVLSERVEKRLTPLIDSIQELSDNTSTVLPSSIMTT